MPLPESIVPSRSNNTLVSAATRVKHISRGEESAASSLSRNVVVALVSHIGATSRGESSCFGDNFLGEQLGSEGGVDRLGKAALRLNIASVGNAPKIRII